MQVRFPPVGCGCALIEIGTQAIQPFLFRLVLLLVSQYLRPQLREPLLLRIIGRFLLVCLLLLHVLMEFESGHILLVGVGGLLQLLFTFLDRELHLLCLGQLLLYLGPPQAAPGVPVEDEEDGESEDEKDD